MTIAHHVTHHVRLAHKPDGRGYCYAVWRQTSAGADHGVALCVHLHEALEVADALNAADMPEDAATSYYADKRRAADWYAGELSGVGPAHSPEIKAWLREALEYARYTGD